MNLQCDLKCPFAGTTASLLPIVFQGSQAILINISVDITVKEITKVFTL